MQVAEVEQELLRQLARLRVKWFDGVDISIAAPSLSTPAASRFVASLQLNIRRTDFEWDTSTVNGTVVNKLLRL